MDSNPDLFKYYHIALAARRLGYAISVTNLGDQGWGMRWVDLVEGRELSNHDFLSETKLGAFKAACDFLVDHVAIKPASGSGA